MNPLPSFNRSQRPCEWNIFSAQNKRFDWRWSGWPGPDEPVNILHTLSLSTQSSVYQTHLSRISYIYHILLLLLFLCVSVMCTCVFLWVWVWLCVCVLWVCMCIYLVSCVCFFVCVCVSVCRVHMSTWPYVCVHLSDWEWQRYMSEWEHSDINTQIHTTLTFTHTHTRTHAHTQRDLQAKCPTLSLRQQWPWDKFNSVTTINLNTDPVIQTHVHNYTQAHTYESNQHSVLSCSALSPCQRLALWGFLNGQ